MDLKRRLDLSSCMNSAHPFIGGHCYAVISDDCFYLSLRFSTGFQLFLAKQDKSNKQDLKCPFVPEHIMASRSQQHFAFHFSSKSVPGGVDILSLNMVCMLMLKSSTCCI